mgnify:CR=1 FL=1|tara:strand:+ start:2603 stop:3019 length:417 start_codon:yes stop_codon:yes gene_type:complete
MEENTKTNKGALFTTKDQRIFKGGRINVNGTDHHFLVSERKSKEGKSVYELYSKAGYININTNKNKETSPDILGNFDYNTYKFDLAGWKKESQSGSKYISIAVKFNEEESAKNDGFNEIKEKIDESKTEKELDDEVPF